MSIFHAKSLRCDGIAHIVSAVLLLAAGGCAADAEEDEVFDEFDAIGPYGCWEIGDWSAIAYEGAGFVTASMDGEVEGHPVGRTQMIQLRESHVFSIDSYTSSITGNVGASAWQWHAHCDDGSDTYGRWSRTQEIVNYATGCTTISLQVRVKVANCVDPVEFY